KIRALGAPPSGGDPKRHRGHIVVWRRVGTKLLNGGENGVDQLARRCVTRGFHHIDQALGPELAAERIVRLEDSVGTEHEHITASKVERDLVVRRAGKRAERDAGQLDLVYFYGGPCSPE